jgi:hypothetical protein
MKLFSNIFLGLAALSAVVYANENGYGCSKKHDGESKCSMSAKHQHHITQLTCSVAGKRLPTGHVAVKTCYHRMWRVKACKLGCELHFSVNFLD